MFKINVQLYQLVIVSKLHITIQTVANILGRQPSSDAWSCAIHTYSKRYAPIAVLLGIATHYT